ncbi:Protein TRANSPARENT TESTA 12 [Morus notabilis]|uniref:Protein TRANSPARENT TESTA 12 n=1 Tax=Morus notabilis TaxID=981085 RepID=W9SHY1_9ROSA|nr:Protein TRANSPARENT TESTA 12 [Morus notabilis]
MASAVQTVCGQAYGAKQYSAMGIICQRAIILHLAAAILLTFVYWFSGPILILMGQSESIADQGQIFARGLILQLYAFAISCPMQRFLQGPEHTLTLGFSWWLLVIMNGLYILFSPNCKETWTGFSWKAFGGIWPYFKLTLASAVMLCLEIWYNQRLVLISGLITNPTISLDSISICVRVSNELGAGHPRVAKFSVFVVNGTSILISIVFSAIVLIFKVGLSMLFTSDSEVIEAVSELTPLLAISVFLNGVQPILSGVAIGSGWQAVVAYVNLAAYYIIGLPIGCVLGFKSSLGVAGIWWGMIIGVLLQTLTLIILTAKTNWNAEVAKAAHRLRTSTNDENPELINSA